jgi:hypothetical protein
MKYLIIIAVALSVLFLFIGAFFKMESMQGGEIFLLIGMMITPPAVIGIAAYKLTQVNKPGATLELDPDRVPATVAKELLLEEDDLTV